MPKHYLQEWVSNDRILVCRFPNTAAETVDEWYEEMQTIYTNFPDDQPVCLMLDLRRAGGIPSPRALFRARSVAQLRPNLPGRTAILIESRMARSVFSQLLEGTTTDSIDREREIFTNENEAVTWLLGIVP